MKTLGVIIIVLIVLGGLWYIFVKPSATPVPTGDTTATTQTTPTDDGATPMTLSSGTSNADLDADLTQVDTGIQGTQSDSASVDQSMNDQPVSQTE